MTFHHRLRPAARLLGSVLALVALVVAAGCSRTVSVQEATPEEVRAFFKSQRKTVLTFVGYSGAEYEDRAAMLQHATAVLADLDPKAVVVNIGATVDGIGAVYEIAKAHGFTTTGIVSTQARDSNATISPSVDHVFFVSDAAWGGFLEGQTRLSPTSATMVDVSDWIVAIGGGDVARDEMIGAMRAGKDVRFIAADMNHKIARDRAIERGQPEPTDFRGSAAGAARVN